MKRGDGSAILLVLGLASCVYADAVVELLPNAPGPYSPGQAVTVDVVFTATDIPDSEYVRGLGLDYSSTDPGIALPETMDFVDDPHGVYSMFPNLPYPALIYPGSTPNPAVMIELAPQDPVLIGSVEVIVNDTGLLDVFPASVGLIDASGTSKSWTSLDGTLTGGSLLLEVPEPASLALLGIGAIHLLRRSRRGKRG